MSNRNKRSAGDQMTPANVPDSRQQEGSAAKQALEQSREARQLNVNEGGRTSTDGRDKGNPPGAVHGLPKPSQRETGR